MPRKPISDSPKMLRWLDENADDVALLAGVAVMAWAQWGWPADPSGSFALGMGLTAVPMYRQFRWWCGVVRRANERV